MQATRLYCLEMHIVAWLSFTCLALFCKEDLTKRSSRIFAVELLPVSPLEPSSQLPHRMLGLLEQEILVSYGSMPEMHDRERAPSKISIEMANDADMFGAAMMEYR
jgi:hypothetical protein